MKRKPRLTTVLAILLLLVGLGVLLYPTASDLYTQWRLKKEIGEYSQVAEGYKEDFSKLWQAAEDYNRTLLEKPSQFMLEEGEADLVATLLNPLGTGMLGYIDIPKIDVHLPVYQGTGEKALQSGAGYWLGSSLPTGGPGTHCVITAHTGLVKAKMFTDLDQLEVGDTFSLSVLDRELLYRVDQIRITQPEEMGPLYVVEGEDYFTLYTCYPYGVNTQRLLVRGRRVDSAEDPNVTILNVPFSQADQRILVISLGILLLLILAEGILVAKLVRRKRAQRNNSIENRRNSGK